MKTRGAIFRAVILCEIVGFAVAGVLLRAADVSEGWSLAVFAAMVVACVPSTIALVQLLRSRPDDLLQQQPASDDARDWQGWAWRGWVVSKMGRSSSGFGHRGLQAVLALMVIIGGMNVGFAIADGRGVVHILWALGESTIFLTAYVLATKARRGRT